jgi:acyl-homoserine-lactone acylase
MILALALQLAATSPHTATERDQPTASAETVTIHQDKYGVPHIYGPTDASVVFGLMYAQAEGNFWLLEEDYPDGLGRRAEVYGDSILVGDACLSAAVSYHIATTRASGSRR